MSRTYVLCDGNVEECTKEGCYKNGGECNHTTNIKHALNPPEKRRFINTGKDDNWEISGF